MHCTEENNSRTATGNLVMGGPNHPESLVLLNYQRVFNIYTSMWYYVFDTYMCQTILILIKLVYYETGSFLLLVVNIHQS